MMRAIGGGSTRMNPMRHFSQLRPLTAFGGILWTLAGVFALGAVAAAAGILAAGAMIPCGVGSAVATIAAGIVQVLQGWTGKP